MKNLSLKTAICTLCIGLFLTFTATAQDEEKGDLLLVDLEYVSPDNMDDYVAWGKEFKKLADETKFKDFFVGANNEAFYYVWNIGKDNSGLDAHEEAWGKWTKANPKVNELYEKYKHTLDYRERELWRVDPKHSYRPEGYEPSRENTYSRFFYGYIKTGQEEAMSKLLDEYAAEWKAKGISSAYTIYWNVFGKEHNCMLVVSSYKDREAWLADRKEVYEKVGKEKLDAWDKRWNSILRKSETREGFPQNELSHFNDE
jgi:hypothetical protein